MLLYGTSISGLPDTHLFCHDIFLSRLGNNAIIGQAGPDDRVLLLRKKTGLPGKNLAEIICINKNIMRFGKQEVNIK